MGELQEYCSADHNWNLSTIDVFNYLKALLKGSAGCSVQGVALTEANYTAQLTF